MQNIWSHHRWQSIYVPLRSASRRVTLATEETQEIKEIAESLMYEGGCVQMADVFRWLMAEG